MKKKTNNEEQATKLCEVWECRFPDRLSAGFLVTIAGRLDKPLAFIPFESGETCMEARARETAEEVARDPDCLEYGVFFDSPAFDMRGYGRPDSNQAVPRWIYALRCRIDGSDGDYDRSPCPPCKFLMNELQKAMEESRP